VFFFGIKIRRCAIATRSRSSDHDPITIALATWELVYRRYFSESELFCRDFGPWSQWQDTTVHGSWS